jgi:DNA-binding CsgD family transcriptional regulator/tetratricopeptide (TPR) repeat protein
VWLDGEPGIGRTALLAAGLDQAESLGCHLFVARADESGQILPLLVLLDALRIGPQAADRVRAEIADRLWGPSATRVVMLGDPVVAAAELLVTLVERICVAGPVVLAVDDLQWVDEMTLAVWSRLGRAVNQLPLLLLAAARPVPKRKEIDRLRLNLADAGSLELRLGPLSPEDVAAQVQQLVSHPPGLKLRRLLAGAGGNPLYVRELVDSLTSERRIQMRGGLVELVEGTTGAPESSLRAVGARLTFLSETTTRILRLASLLGEEFRVEHLSLLTDRPASALSRAIEEAIVAGVLGDSGTMLAFRHTLIHQALYASMPRSLRDALHQQAAQALAVAKAPAEAVAGHLLAARRIPGDWTTAWLAGAAPTLTRRAPHLAVDLLQGARQAIESTDPRRAMLDVHLIDAQYELGGYHDVETLARSLLASNHNPDVAGRVTWTRARARAVLGHFDQSLAITGQALAEQTTTDVWSARLRALHALSLTRTARHVEALDAARQAVAHGELAGDRLAVGWAIFASSLVQARLHQDDAAALTMHDQAAAALGDEAEATDLRLLLPSHQATALWNLGRQAEAAHVIQQALALAERAGTPAVLATLRLVAAETFFRAGRWDDALAMLEAASDIPLYSPVQMSLSGVAALIAVHRDDDTAMRRYLRDAEAGSFPTGYVGAADNLSIARAFAAERDGRPEQALTVLLEVLDPQSNRLFERLSYNPDSCLWLIDTVRLALGLGDNGIAEAASQACSAEATRHPLPATMGATQHCRGLVEADHAQLLSAADEFGRGGYPHFQAAALEGAAVLLAQRGDVANARSVYTDARRTYTELDATWDLRRADARLRSYGIRHGVRSRRRRPSTGWDALTPTEIKIANLIAAGRSNPDIATNLYLSRNTVQTHVSHILAKLDCRTRIEIARMAVTQHQADAEGS